MDIVDTALIEKKREAWKDLGLTAPSINKVLTTLSAIFDKQLALRDWQRRFSAGRNRMATKLITLKQPVLFRKLPAWTLQTFTKLGVPQDWVSCPTP